jgi:very-short-patch-repair endonuclease
MARAARGAPAWLWRFTGHMREKVANALPDRWIARLATRQHGVVSVAQLLAAGLTYEAIRRRVRTGRLHRIHRGVYAVGHRNLSHQGWWMAAVLACGEGAVLSHRSAAMLWGLRKAIEAPVDVTVPGNGGRARRRGIRVHRSTSLTPKEVTIRQGIPTTTPERTIRDLKRLLTRDELQGAIARAEIQHLPIGKLPGFLHEPTRSELERRFLRLCRRHGLPKPEVNVKVGPYEVDFLWRDQRLAVETDGWETHRTRSAFEADRARDADLKSRGIDVLRFTYLQVWYEDVLVARRVRELLDASRMSP